MSLRTDGCLLFFSTACAIAGTVITDETTMRVMELSRFAMALFEGQKRHADCHSNPKGNDLMIDGHMGTTKVRMELVKTNPPKYP
jgi:hypothetical protein